MRHPARSIPYHELIVGLDAAIAAGHVAYRSEGGFGLYCYTKACVYDGAWNEFTRLARGLIVDYIRGQVVATPFPKFFNVSENKDPLPDLPFEVFPKLDGSLIIIWHDGEQWRASTKGSFNSDQAVWATNWLSTQDQSRLVPGTTYLAEAIYPDNRIVVPYPERMTGLHMLAAYNEDGYELSSDELDQFEFWVRPVLDFHSIGELLETAKILPADKEGWVLRFSNGHRVKIKGDEYLRLHRAVSNLTPLSVWELMGNYKAIDDFKMALPEEFWPDFNEMMRLLTEKLVNLTNSIEEGSAPYRALSDKEVGLILKTIPEPTRSFIFAQRKAERDHELLFMNPKALRALLRVIRPTGNRLEGWVPSNHLTEVQNDV